MKKNIESSTGQFALECLWATYQLGGLDDAFAQQCLVHKEPLVREWTVRLSGDMPLDLAAAVNATGRGVPGPRQVQDAHLMGHRFGETRTSIPLARKLVDAAKSETYVRVRSQLASTAKRLPADQALPLIDALTTHHEDADDIHIPLLLWWALESKATKNSALIVNLFKNPEVWKRPLVEKHLVSRTMQRFAQASTRNDLLVAAELLAKAPTAEHKQELLKGFEAAFKGRPLSGLPDELVKEITEAGGGSLALRVRQKDAAAIDEALKLVAVEPAAAPDPKQKAAAEEAKTRRIELVQTLGEVQPSGSVKVLLALAKTSADNDVRSAALTALLGDQDEAIGSEVLTVFTSLHDDVQSVALTLLTSRSVWARQLVEAIDAGKLKPDVLPIDVVRKLTFLKDDKLAALVKKHWPKLEGASTAEMQELIARFASVAKSEGGEPFEGKKIFMQSCGKCHLLFGEGGRIGPDLTTFKRDDVQHILTNVINPSAEIREGFEAIVVITTDGRTVTGFRADQDARVLVVRGIDGQNITISRDNIEEIVPQKKSLMPEGLLNNLTADQVRNLFTYLRVGQPLNAQ